MPQLSENNQWKQLVLLGYLGFNLKHWTFPDSHAHEKKQLVNEIVSLKKFKNGYERESSRREVHVKQVETEANKGLDALRDAEERIQMLRNQVQWRHTPADVVWRHDLDVTDTMLTFYLSEQWRSMILAGPLGRTV